MVNRKQHGKEELDAFFDLGKRHNILFKLDMILGLPAETIDSYLDGLDRIMSYVEDTDHFLQPAFLQILPGSRLEGKCAEFGLKYFAESGFVRETPHLGENELLACARVTILAYRILHSSLRIPFFGKARSHGVSKVELLKRIEHFLRDEPAGAKFFSKTDIPSLYRYSFETWDVYRDIGETLLQEILKTSV